MNIKIGKIYEYYPALKRIDYGKITKYVGVLDRRRCYCKTICITGQFNELKIYKVKFISDGFTAEALESELL